MMKHQIKLIFSINQDIIVDWFFIETTHDVLRDFELTKREAAVAHHGRIFAVHVHGLQQHRDCLLFDAHVQRRSLGALDDVEE